MYAQTKIRPRELDAKRLWEFKMLADPLISARRPDLGIIHTHTHKKKNRVKLSC